MAKVLPIEPKANELLKGSFDALNALQSLPIATFILNSKAEICFANIAAEQLFLASERVLQTKGLGHYFPYYQELEGAIAQTALSLSGVSLPKVKFEKDPKTVLWLDIELSNLANEKQTQVLMTVTGVYDQPPAQGQQVDHVASLADMLAHEVKNPLSGIRGAAQLLEQGVSDSDKKLTDIICNECDRISSLVDGMENLSNNSPLTMEAVNIHHSLDHVLSLSKAGFAKNINILKAYDPSLPEVFANADALVQLFLNLIKNSAEAIEEADIAGRGEITVKTAYVHGGLTSHLNQDVPTPIEITISDNGTGISLELINSLFEPFVTQKKVGKGLGLALVKKLINAHNGHIIAENSETGAQFRVYLPMFSEKDSG